MPNVDGRFFLAHAKDHPELDKLQREVMQAAQSLFPNKAIDVVTAKSDYDENFARCGSWDGWCSDVIARCHSITRKPYYAAVIVPGAPSVQIGKATARIVQQAFGLGRPVYLYADGAFRPASRVINEDATGWHYSLW